jgi:hypothetical protein
VVFFRCGDPRIRFSSRLEFSVSPRFFLSAFETRCPRHAVKWVSYLFWGYFSGHCVKGWGHRFLMFPEMCDQVFKAFSKVVSGYIFFLPATTKKIKERENAGA